MPRTGAPGAAEAMVSPAVRNGWATWGARLNMAWKCLRGESVIFNVRFYMADSEPLRLTPISPVSMLHVESSLFYGSLEDPPREAKVVFGD